MLPQLLLRVSPIALNPDNQDKTTFIMPNDIYCYKVMNFGLQNIKAYVDDVVVKTTCEDHLITDLVETFTNLHT
jgi:hypothetical protein